MRSSGPPRRAAAAPTLTHFARQVRFEAVRTRHDRSWTQRRIADELGLDRKTLRAWLRAGQPPSWRQPPRGSGIAPFEDHLRRRWNDSCHNAAQLWREIRAQGFEGGPSVLRDHLARRREADERSVPTAPCSAATRPASARGTAWRIVADADSVAGPERWLIDALAEQGPALGAVIALARRFRRMVRERDAEEPDDRSEAARGSSLRSSIAGVRRDLAAVRAALSVPWSTGADKEQISRLKTLERQMGDGPELGLLRQRVLHAA